MSAEEKIEVAEARDGYLRWNMARYKKLAEVVGNDAFKLISLIPLFYQLNNKLLPGYVNADTPVGVYGYQPDKSNIENARQLNGKFRYHQEGLVKNYAVEAIFFQQKIIDNKLLCWVYFRSSLNKKQVEALKDKTSKISYWFTAKGLKLDFVFVSDELFRRCKAGPMLKTPKALFLNYFYSEIILLAGKYPVWWLVPPSKEKSYMEFVEHINKVRYVDNEAFFDLGSTADLAQSDIVRHAVDLVQKVKQAPEICLVKLMIANQMNDVWPEIDGIANRQKRNLYFGDSINSTADIVANIMHDSLNRNSYASVMTPVRLFSRLRGIPGKLNINIVDAFLEDNALHEMHSSGVDKIILYLNLFKAVSNYVHQIFASIVRQYHAQNNAGEENDKLHAVTRNMLVMLSAADNRVPLYNNKETIDIILDRIILKHEILSETDSSWSLVLDVADGDTKSIDGFSSLLGVLSWCWLNRVVNNATLVSIDCPLQQIKQVEAYFMLETLIQHLNPILATKIPVEAFENAVRPLQSLMFAKFPSQDDESFSLLEKGDSLNVFKQPNKKLIQCDQLIINSWGEVYTRQYSGNSGILMCLCEWTHHALLGGLAKPQLLSIYGYGEGDSTHLAQRINEIYQQLLKFFYFEENKNGCFYIKMDRKYHVVSVEKSRLISDVIGGHESFIRNLESASDDFRSVALERLAFSDYPLREIYIRNKENVFQVFFKVISQKCHCWVLDEKGSLWSDVINAYDRGSYTTHWLVFFNNIKQRLMKINDGDESLILLEINHISNDRLGAIEFNTLELDKMKSNKTYFDVKLSISGVSGRDQISLVCDGHDFSYARYKQQAMSECMQYLSAKIASEGRRPIFITDIDVPLRLFEIDDKSQLQISHILKFKKKFESRMNKLVA